MSAGTASKMLTAWGITLLSGIALGYLSLLLMVYFSQAKMLYLPDLPSRQLIGTPASRGMAFEEIRLTTEDGVRLHGWYLPDPEASHTLLFFHGNAGNISHRMESLEIFRQLGLSVLIFDYRGYGSSTGTPSEPGTYRDGEAAWRYLVDERGLTPGRIILFGRSLGAAVAAGLPQRDQAAGLILESTFTSVPDMASELYPWLPARWLSKFRYDTLSRLPELTLPLLIVHSRNDEIIPYRHGQRLFDAANGPKHLLQLNGDHNGGFMRERDRYIEGLRRFIASLDPAA